MKEHIIKFILILIIFSLAYVSKIPYPYIITISFIASTLSVFSTIGSLPLAYIILPINAFYIYSISILISFLTLFLKKDFYKNLSLYIIYIASIISYYLIYLNITEFILSTVLLSFLIILYNLPFIKSNYKDKLIYKPLLYGISIALFYYSKSYYLGSILLSSTITSPLSFIITPILLYYNKLNLFNVFFIMIPSLNFTKKPFVFISYTSLIFIIFYYICPTYLISLIFPLFYFFLKQGYSSSIINKNPSYKNYIEALLKSKPQKEYDTLDYKINECIKTYCACCKLRNTCFKKNRIHLYQYFIYILTNNTKENENIKYFLYNCEYKEEIDKLNKLNFKEHAFNKSLADILSFEKSYDIVFNKLISFFKKSSYKLKKLENKSRNSIFYRLEFYDKFISVPLLNYRISHLLKTSTVLKKEENTYLLYEEPILKLNFDSIVLAKGNIYISGDNILIKQFQNDYYFALSDGMGSGLKAYEASKGILQKLNELIELEIDDDKILKSLKHIYEILGYNDNYGTLDFLHISKTSKKAMLYKVASSSSYHISDRGNNIYKTETLPLEMDSIISKYEFELIEGDLIVLASDGLSIEFNDNEALNIISFLRYKDSNKIVYELAQKVFEKSKSRLNDDLSLIAIKIKLL